jgi:acetolactate synthase-1/2/3 large subunit
MNGGDRRSFLKRTAGGAAGLIASSRPADSQQPEPARAAQTPAMSKDAETSPPTGAEVLTTEHPGADFMTDVIKSLGFEYVCANPGSSFRALHESIVNHGGNHHPEFLTCLHEESAVGIAHGYAKIEGKPLAVLVHGTVGLQHAAMAIYNAYCDRVPVYLVLGNTLDAATRRPGVEWIHSVQDAAAMVRDFVKWDDLPMSLTHFAESAVRAYKIAMTPPTLPVLLVADGDLQENPIPEGTRLRIPKLTLPTAPQGDSGAIREAARLLLAAESPVLVADRAVRTAKGLNHLIELAETLQAAVIDQAGRMNFPTHHPLNQTERRSALIAGADVILGLELTDFWGTVTLPRSVAQDFAPSYQSRCQADQHHVGGSLFKK